MSLCCVKAVDGVHSLLIDVEEMLILWGPPRGWGWPDQEMVDPRQLVITHVSIHSMPIFFNYMDRFSNPSPGPVGFSCQNFRLFPVNGVVGGRYMVCDG